MAHPGPWDKGPPSWRQGPPHWWAGRRTKRRFLFWRFAAIIGAFFAVFLGFFVLFLALVYKPLVEAFPQPSALLGLNLWGAVRFCRISGYHRRRRFPADRLAGCRYYGGG